MGSRDSESRFGRSTGNINTRPISPPRTTNYELRASESPGSQQHYSCLEPNWCDHFQVAVHGSVSNIHDFPCGRRLYFKASPAPSVWLHEKNLRQASINRSTAWEGHTACHTPMYFIFRTTVLHGILPHGILPICYFPLKKAQSRRRPTRTHGQLPSPRQRSSFVASLARMQGQLLEIKRTPG